MVSYDSLARALDEQEITNRVAVHHDEARGRYALSSNRVSSFEDFTEQITRYFDYHYAACVTGGARLSPPEARSEAKQLLESRLRRGEGDIVTWFVRARDGRDGGLRVCLDNLAEALKERAVSHYIRDAFDRHVAPHCWEDKVEIIRQFFEQCGPYLSTAIQPNTPERYAHDATSLINEYTQSLRRTSAMFRRL
ncbi:MAG: hypothetical protein J5J06_16240 [Phycisphaerae bacterium]|nr:hypothetical protein [Phycisphaerae bacterium]